MALSLSSTLAILIVSFAIGRVLHHNPYWIGRSAGPPPRGFEIFSSSHPILDAALTRYESELGDDLEAYRNHNLRVLTFTVHHLGARAKDERLVNLAALALAYHDIGLWSDKELDYLEPSVRALERDVTLLKSAPVDDTTDDLTVLVQSLSDSELETLRQIILQHHKVTAWEAPADGTNIDGGLVNAVRKSDWADATVGAIRFGLPPSCLEAAYRAIPEAGFHMMLAGMGERLRPNAFLGGKFAVPDIFRW